MDEAKLLRAKDLAARHLGRRMRSVREIETYLERKGFEPGIIRRLVADFGRVGLLDDRALAEDWARYRVERMPCGRRALRQSLIARRIPRDTIDSVLDEVLASDTERELSRRAASGFLRRLNRLPPEARKQRLYRFLVRRGFSRETITELFEEADIINSFIETPNMINDK